MYNYKELKKKKLAKLRKEGDNFFLNVTRFDQSTGEKKESITFNLEKWRLEHDKARYEREVADTAEILKDMEVLEKAEKKK